MDNALLTLVAFLLSVALNGALLYARTRKPRCPALRGQHARCKLKEAHHGPHYARWYTGSMYTPIEEAHWNDPEPELTRDERLALEDLRVARQLASFDQQLKQKPPPTSKPFGPRKLPS